MPKLLRYYGLKKPTLISSVYGLYKCNSQYFVVMKNTFEKLTKIDNQYDLKGSRENAKRNELKEQVAFKATDRKYLLSP